MAARSIPQGSKLNRLERAIVAAEDSAEDARWAQAEEVVRLLDSGQSQRKIAASWINGRSGEPYDHMHVQRYAKIWREFGEVPLHDRPPFTTVYDKVSNRSTTRIERTEAQAPRSVETAEKLVQNIIDKSPDKVEDAVYHGLKLARQGKHQTPVERKATEARTREGIKPLRQAVARFTAISVVISLQSATEELREMIGDDALTEDVMNSILDANSEWNNELEVARAMLGMEDEDV